MKATTLRISFLYRIFLDIFILASLLAVAHNLTAFRGQPLPVNDSPAATIGFFCGDPNLGYPYVGNSVSRRTLYRIGQHTPLLVILIVEVLRFRSEATDASISATSRLHQATGSYLAAFLLQLYQPTSCFLFGYAAERFIRSISKDCFPRLRPHFFHVCQPQLASLAEGGEEGALVNICADSSLQHRFIVNYTCAASDSVTSEMLHGLSSSFPSGHASLSCFGMVFLVLYLQQRLVWRRSHLLRPALQLSCVLVAWYVSLSRIWDHMHHASDVVVGAALGTAIAVAAAQYVGDGCSAQAEVGATAKMAHAVEMVEMAPKVKSFAACSSKDGVSNKVMLLEGVA